MSLSIDPCRTEFGQPRIKCACRICVANCKFMPGYLIPADLERIIPKEVDPFQWAEANLRASPGALVKNSSTGELWRIPTLVPARKVSDGSCIHLTPDNRCGIHDIAPFGCAFFSHKGDGTDLSWLGLIEVDKAQQDANSLYSYLWNHLFGKGLIAAGPDESRKKMNRYLEQKTPWWRKKRKRI